MSISRRYFFLCSADALIPFHTVNGWVSETDMLSLPPEVRDLAGLSPIFSFKKKVEQIGYKVKRNAWLAKNGIQFRRTGDMWSARATGMHMATGNQKTVGIESSSPHKKDAIDLFFDCWTTTIVKEFEHLGLHTHLEHAVNGIKYPEI